MKTVGASITRIEPGKVVIGFPFDPGLTQQHGFIHAGIVSTVLDSACGYAAFSLMPVDAAVLTIPGRNITVTEGEIYAYQGDSKKLVASMVGTMMAVFDRDHIQG